MLPTSPILDMLPQGRGGGSAEGGGEGTASLLEDILLDHPVRFPPPNGDDTEWEPVEQWTDRTWEHWLLSHNNYPFLRQWTVEECAEYLNVDRFKYGVGARTR